VARKIMLLFCAVIVSLVGLSCGSGKPVVKNKAAVVPVKVLLVRHCQYEHSGQLTDLGRKQSAGIAAKLQKENIQLILHSPVVRCVQTARIIREKLGKPLRELRSCEWLGEHSDQASTMLEEFLAEHKTSGTLLLVTHQPVVQQLCNKPNATTFGVITQIR
jgi:phosphohistidine phosphatase SixA